MIIHVHISVDGEQVRSGTIDIEPHKIEELTQEELEAAIDIRVRQWMDDHVEVTWETEEGEG